MRPRTRELLEQADEWLDYARLMVSAGGAASAISGVGPPAIYRCTRPDRGDFGQLAAYRSPNVESTAWTTFSGWGIAACSSGFE